MSDDVQSISFTLNGEPVTVEVPARWTLVDVLRNALRQTGTHVGCEHGICGTCTIVLDGQPARSCLMLAGQVEGCDVQTVEGLGTAEDPHPIQEAFSHRRALQCGFCTPGFLMLAKALFDQNPNPTESEINDVVASNLCRCTDYSGILAAFHDVASGITTAQASNA